MKKKVLIVLALIMAVALVMISCEGDQNIGPCTVKWAGIRYSEYGIRRTFGKNNYPTPSKTASLINKMQGYYEDSTGAIILIVGLMHGDDSCSLTFPTSSGYKDKYVEDSDEDEYEELLTVLDSSGISVWLQVEPGNADLVKLAKEVMTHYKHHPCVKGFGIDVEWYRPAGTDGYGTRLSSSLADQVLAAVREVGEDYTVFVKHWDWKWLPEAKEGFIYVNDSQNFLDLDEEITNDEINALVNTIAISDANDAARMMRMDFSDWARHFAPCPVMFQIGYQKDKPIWKRLYSNPAKELGDYILSGCNSGNDVGIIWVDFTLSEVL